jgi:hypothetical protein
MCQQILVKLRGVMFHENPISIFELNADRRTDSATLMGEFLQLLVVNTPND